MRPRLLRSSRPNRWIASASILLLLVLAGSVRAAELSYQVLALEGQQVPGAPAGVVYNVFTTPVTNAAGGVGAVVGLAGTGVNSSNRTALVGPDGAGGLVMLAREGDLVLPGGIAIGAFGGGSPAFDDLGAAAFLAFLEGPGVGAANDFAVFRVAAGQPPAVVLREGDPTPIGGTFGSIASVQTLANDGTISVIAWVAGTGGGRGSWLIDSADVIRLVARTSHPAPGFSFNLVEGSSGFETFVASSAALAMRAQLQTSGNPSVLWRADPGGSALVLLKTGDPVPATPGSVFGFLGLPVVLPNGAMSFAASEGPAGGAHLRSLWTRTGATLSRAVREGDPAPGTSGVYAWRQVTVPAEPGGTPSTTWLAPFPDTGTHGFEDATPPINQSGDIAFVGVLSGSVSTSGIWSTHEGVLQPRALRNTPVPGLSGVSYGGPDTIYYGFTAVSLNDAGDVLFGSTLAGAGVTTSNDFALMAVEADGTAHVIARDGDPFEVAPGDVRTLQHDATGVRLGVYRPWPEATSRCCEGALGDPRMLALMLRFTDGSSGLVVASLGEPAPVPIAAWPWAFAAAAAFTLFARRALRVPQRGAAL